MILFSLVNSPKGAFGVPVAYERGFRYKLGQFRYLCQSAVLQGHVKINVSRNTLFEDSFHQVRSCVLCYCLFVSKRVDFMLFRLVFMWPAITFQRKDMLK